MAEQSSRQNTPQPEPAGQLGCVLWAVRSISGFALVAGVVWFVPAAWTLFIRDEMDKQDAYHRIMAGCAVLGLGLLVGIYDQLLVIGGRLNRLAADRKSAGAKIEV